MASPISSGVKITLSARLFGKRAYVFCEGTWQLAIGNWQLGTGNCEPGKCHRHQLAIASATLCFSHSLNSLTYFWKCQNELKLLNYFLYTHIWQRASRNRSISRQVGDSGKLLWSLLMALGRKIHWPIGEDRFHHGQNQLNLGRFRWVCVMGKNV